MAAISAIKLPNGTIYTLKDNGALQLTGGQVTGPVSFGDSVSIDEATLGDLIVNGSASFTNGAHGVIDKAKAADVTSTLNALVKYEDTEGTFSDSNIYNTSNNLVIGSTSVPGNIQIGAKNDNYGILPNTSNYNQIGSTSLYWYRAYVTNYYGGSSHVTNWDAGKNIGTSSTSSAAATLGSVYFYNACAAGGTQTKTLLSNGSATSNITITLPSTAGTLALTSQIPDISGKADKSATVSTVAYDSTNKKITKTINGTTSDVVTVATLKTALGYTASDVGALPSSTTYVSTITTTAGTHSAISSKSGAVSFNVPTKTSHLTNDSGFITASHTSTYSLPLAASGTRGGVKIGYSESGKNYAVKLSSEKMYVTVPWTDTKLQVDTLPNNGSYSLIAAPSNTTQPITGYIDADFTIDSNTTNGTSTLSIGGYTNRGQIELGKIINSSITYTTLKTSHTTARTITFPDKDGTVALTSDIPTVPTKVSQLTNDSGYITGYTETDPTVPSWAKASSKPSYTASEVGAAASSHTHGNITNGGDITATAPTIASGDQIIINDNSASKITNGPTFDGSTTTKALTPKGTWETFLKSYTETDPTVPSWAKASSKPSYTASEVGAVPTSRTVNGKALSANITLSASDVSALPSSTSILSTSPTLSSTGLTPYSNRCSITKGGVYSFGDWRFVQLQVTVKSSLSANNTWGLIDGFDVPSSHTGLAALAVSCNKNYGNISGQINASGRFTIQTGGQALASNDILIITGWYVV